MRFDLENIDAIVTDLDGTLYNKHGIAAKLILRDLVHLPYLLAERLARRRLRGQSFGSAEAYYNVYFQEMARNMLFRPAQAQHWYNTTYLPCMVDIIGKHYGVRSWVPELISQCKKRHIPIVVYSDYDFVREKLQVLHLDEKDFAFVISAPSLGGLKPSKESAMQILERLGAKAERTLFIGDRYDTDAASAIAVGAKYQLINTEEK